MSHYSRPRSDSIASRNSRLSNRSNGVNQHRGASAASGNYGAMAGPTITPASEHMFEACAATASYFIYAQMNVILVLHHDTLDIERRFERHRDDVRWIQVDNVSERGAGRMAVSYDASLTAIVWDIFTGDELARFASYEEMRTAAWMKNGEIAFGNDQGNIILFDPTTKEHMSRKTIYDPITAITPSIDCRTFAIGYANGSILIAGLHPTFTMIHTLSTQRQPSPINQLAWHGSSSKSKSDMLASQTMDGDLRVWSIPKGSNTEQPTVIRNFQQGGMERTVGACWFGWSKMGRIVQHINNNTFAWDVRTKKVTYESVPTVDGTIAIANYGPHAVLFTVGRNHTVQQYDLNPNGTPMLVKNVQHVPAKLPPSPARSNGEHMRMPSTGAGAQSQRRNNNLPVYLDAESSEGGEDFDAMSPLARLAHDNQSISEQSMSEQSEEEQEERDLVGPLSPVSSRSSTISRNSDRQQKKKRPTYPNRYERSSSSRLRPQSPGMASQASGSTISRSGGSTVFSSGTSTAGSAAGGHRPSTRGSRLREEVIQSPEDAKPGVVDLFPFLKARLSETPFRPPRYPDGPRTPDMLRREMLKTVFGWDGEADELIRAELEQHGTNSSAGVLLAKWLGDLGADLAASMVGSQSMTSSDWMLLALSAVGGDAQKKVGDAFVVRLLEKGDLHPAVAILLGLGEIHEAIEIYVSRGYCLEAVLLCCLMTPHDWQRQSHLVRQWGEAAISQQRPDPELAVRCFACTSVQSSESWFSPAAKDAVYEAQMRYMGPGINDAEDRSPASPASSSNPRRVAPRSAGLKLITNFGDEQQQSGRMPRSAVGDDRTPMTRTRTTMTPMDQTYTPMIGRQGREQSREPMSSITATPGGLTSRRMPSRGRWVDEFVTPIVRDAQTAVPASASRIRHQQELLLPDNSRFNDDGHLPSPAAGIFNLGSASARARNGSRDRKPQGLELQRSDIVVIEQPLQSGSTIASYNSKASRLTAKTNGTRGQALYSPAMTDASVPLSAQIRSLDEYVHNMSIGVSADDSRRHGENRPRESRRNRSRAPSDAGSKRYVQNGKRSPSSPVSMSPDDPALRVHGLGHHEPEVERFYRAASPTESSMSMMTTETSASRRGRNKAASISHVPGGRSTSKAPRRGESVDPQNRGVSRSRRDRMDGSRPVSPEVDHGRRGRSRAYESARHSPDSPVSMTLGLEEEQITARKPRDQSVGAKIRARAASQNRQQSPDRLRTRARGQSTSRGPSPDQQTQHRVRSQSAKPADYRPESPVTRSSSRQMSRSRIPKIQTDFSEPPPSATKRFTAAQELEARRRSLLRRPSAPAIPHPDEFVPRSATGPGSPGFPMSPIDHESTSRRMTNLSMSSDHRIPSEHELIRSQTADPESQSRRQVGLPATPRAMRHPKYSAEAGEDVPAVPQLPPGLTHVQNAPKQDDYLQTLPSSSFTLQPATFQAPSRSASAPPEKYLRQHSRRTSRQDNQRPSHQRMGSLNEIAVSPPLPPESYHNEPQSAVLGSSVMIISDPDNSDIILPELQHLAQQIPPPPPPPPPPPAFRPMSAADLSDAGVIDIAIDENTGAAIASPPLSQTVYSPPAHVRRPSADTVSLAPSTTESNKGGFLRGVRDRMTGERSASRSRGKSPNRAYAGPSPYESVPSVQQQPPPFARVGSCPPMAMHGPSMSLDAATNQAPLTLLPAVSYQAPAKPNSNAPRDPKAIARAMTAEQVQFGLDVPPSGLAAAIAQQQQPGALGLLPSTTYLPERPQTTAPQSNIQMPRGMEQYRDPKGFRADMPPTSTQPGAAAFMEGRPF